MNNIRTREWSKLEYKDPKRWLLKLKEIEKNILPYVPEWKVRSFRTNKLSWINEARQAGILTYGMSLLNRQNIVFSLHENSDFDFIARYIDGDVDNYIPVQLKEFVSEAINPEQTLSDIFNKLNDYSSSQDLTVGIYISRNINLKLDKIKLNNKNIGEVYLFGSTSKNNTKWFIYGDIQGENPLYFEFEYPS